MHICDEVLGDTPDSAQSLGSDNGYGDAYRYLHTGPAAAETSDGERVRVTTLDAWAIANGVRDVDFLKVDIEGGEYRMFLGSQQFLDANSRIVLFFECEADWCARAGCSQNDVFDLLRARCFGLYTWDKRAQDWTDAAVAIAATGMLWARRDRAVLPRPVAG